MPTTLRSIIFFASAVVAFALPAAQAAAADAVATGAAVFQFATVVKTSAGEREAFLWIPPQAEQVRGVLVAGMSSAERELVKDAAVRRACRAESLAIVFLTTGISSINVQQVLDDFAAASGYHELSVAPLFFAGHSAGGPQAKAAAVAHRDRCFGVMQYRGGSPGIPANSLDPDPVPPGVPAVMMLGQYDEFGKIARDESGRENWENGVVAMRTFRSAAAGNLGCFAVEPGAGHFAWSDRSAAYFAVFLRKAAAQRIPDWSPDAKTPVTCRQIDATRGWLTELPTRAAARHAPAPVTEYTGDPGDASWHFDREMAEATVAHHRGLVGKRDQFIRWADPCTVKAGARFFFDGIAWIGDGQTFEVRPQFAETYPRQYDGEGPIWAQAGQPVGNSAQAIRVRPTGGPLVAVGPNAFRVQFDALAPAPGPKATAIIAFVDGDEQWRYAEQVGIVRSMVLTEGQEQAITFPALPDMNAGDGNAPAPIELQATSDSSLPVEYYVAHGPATIENGRLMLHELPRRARLPIEIKVVAYQFGRGIEPRVKAAAPVTRVLRVR
jgi:hypothetical protein